MSSKVIITVTSDFQKMAKQLAKKHRSFPNDLEGLIGLLEEDPYAGDRISKNYYKIRLAIRSKGRGKSGGARVITNVETEVITSEEVIEVLLLTVYDKSDRPNISSFELDSILKKHNFSKEEEEEEE